MDPLFAVKDDEETLLKWLKDSVQFRVQASFETFKTQRHNLQAYTGHYHKRGGRQSDSIERMPMPKTTKYFVNHLYEMTEVLVSKMTRMKPAIDVLPANGNFEDKNDAKLVDLLIKHLWYINDLDFIIQKIHRHKIIFGEAYCMIKWNKQKGDYTPEYKAVMRAGKQAKVPKDVCVKTGDVDFEMILPWNVLLEAKPTFEQCSNVIIKEIFHKEEIKHWYPNASLDSLDSGSGSWYDVEGSEEKRLEKYVDLFTLYNKEDEHFRQGRKVVFTLQQILYDSLKDKTEPGLGYSHGEFPFIRVTDIDVPSQVRGRSRYQMAMVIQNAHNNLSQAMIKNEFLMGAPKWMVPRGAVKPEQLANGRTIVQYQGERAPQLVQMNPTSPMTMNFRDKIAQELGIIMQVSDISRGEPPKGVIAAVAMQFIAEQDNERSSSDIAKHNQMVVDIAKKAISVCGDYYKSDDGRMIQILGKENKYLTRYFDVATLNKDYNIRMLVGSSTPDTKAGKIARVFQAMQYNPTMFDPARWAELMEFGDTDEMATLTDSAILSADSEAEDILSGHPVEEPKEYEDQIVHLRAHYAKMQPRSFKEDVPLDRQEAFILHVKVTEMLAEEKAKTNPLFASQLAQLALYPMFWKPEGMPSSAEHQAALVNGQVNQGQPVTGQIPATPPAPLPGQPQSPQVRMNVNSRG